MRDLAIRVEDLSKEYRIGEKQASYKTLRDTLATTMHSLFVRANGRGSERSNVDSSFWALRDVSFEVKPGEVVGIIGRNGAGKSTLLKILSRITEPTTGSAEIRGRIGSLLEVGTGFHPELTGRDNVILNGAILGMKRAQIEDKLDEIIAFAEVEKFIKTPVKHYSSGMYLRLAFAVAAHLDTEILLVDEVLAVGDAQFQMRCMGKMEEVAKQGRTVLFVSHNMGAISSLCSRILVLRDGGVWADGGTEVIGSYLESIAAPIKLDLQNRTDIGPAKELWVTGLWFANGSGKPVSIATTGQELVIYVRYKRRTSGRRPDVQMGFYDVFGQNVAGCCTITALKFQKYEPGSTEGVIKCIVPKLPLMPGSYRLNVRAGQGGDWQDHLVSVAQLQVEHGDFYGTGKLPEPNGSRVLMEYFWELDTVNREWDLPDSTPDHSGSMPLEPAAKS